MATYARLPITAPPFTIIDLRPVRWPRMMTMQPTGATPDKEPPCKSEIPVLFHFPPVSTPL
jgi:hypothetical protein